VLAAIPLCFLLRPSAHHLEEDEQAQGAATAEYVVE